jgi:hypothetical protein
MTIGSLLHFDRVATGIVYLLLAERTDHGLAPSLRDFGANVRAESQFR